MHYYWLILGILAVWRITHLLHVEHGPWNLIERLRSLAAAGFWHGLLGCFYCLSLWVAVPFALLLGEAWRERLLLWPALSAGAILLERFSAREPAAAPAVYFEEEEENPDVRMLQDQAEPASDIEFSRRWAARG
jgi:hypothetical protein